MEKTIEMATKAYRALVAAGELAAHPEVVIRTILAARDAKKRVPLDEAFPRAKESKVASYTGHSYEKV
jgi:hypothetical protein